MRPPVSPGPAPWSPRRPPPFGSEDAAHPPLPAATPLVSGLGLRARRGPFASRVGRQARCGAGGAAPSSALSWERPPWRGVVRCPSARARLSRGSQGSWGSRGPRPQALACRALRCAGPRARGAARPVPGRPQAPGPRGSGPVNGPGGLRSGLRIGRFVFILTTLGH